MFCNQCEEVIDNIGCTREGACGKKEEISVLQDKLVRMARVISKKGSNTEEANVFIMESLFSTITNVNFDAEHFKERLAKGREYVSISDDELIENRSDDKDTLALKDLLTYGLKGLCAYLDHAYILGYKDDTIFGFIREALDTEGKTAEELTALVLKCGEYGVRAMALLDKANTETYGHPEPTKVSLDVGANPGILISGHDLKDMQRLLDQTDGTGVDVYTHGEMLPAHAYPAFKRYKHLRGNYGGSWWKQNEEFESFNGPILMTTNCLIPPKESYKDRLYCTGLVGFEGVKHIGKDFSSLVVHAKKCKAPIKIEEGEITVGFGHSAVLSVADKIVEAVKNGAIKRFVVMGGCDGRKNRDYYTEFARALPSDAVILTVGCAKYRYNKLPLGDIGGIPRVIDAGQCNDSYSLVVIAKKLADVFGLDDINKLPISYNLSWYEQKAVLVLLALLSLGVKNIHLGPKLPAFISPNVLNVLVEKFGVSGISNVEHDVNKLAL